MTKYITMITYALVLASAAWPTLVPAGSTRTDRKAQLRGREVPASQKAEARAGILKSVRGDVQVIGSNNVVRPARAGDAVAAADRLVTESDSAVSLTLRDGTVIVVGPSSLLDLKEFRFDSTTRDGGMWISLPRGSLRMVSGLIGKTHPDRVRVESRGTVIGVHGTDFIVQAEPGL